MTVRSRSFRSVSPCSTKSRPVMASMGTADRVAVRGTRPAAERKPVPSSAMADSCSSMSRWTERPSAIVTSRVSVVWPISEISTGVGAGGDIGDLVVAVRVGEGRRG